MVLTLQMRGWDVPLGPLVVHFITHTAACDTDNYGASLRMLILQLPELWEPQSHQPRRDKNSVVLLDKARNTFHWRQGQAPASVVTNDEVFKPLDLPYVRRFITPCKHTR